jgi:hypothetical protein
MKPHALRTAESWSRRTLPSVRSTDGLAARAACFTDFAFLAEVFGTAQVEKRLAARLEYVLDLCPFVIPDAGGVDAQIEAAHLVGYFCEDTLSIWRQAAMSQGGYLIGPFSHPAIVPAALRFRRRDRYRRNGETKPALKALLRRRLRNMTRGSRSSPPDYRWSDFSHRDRCAIRVTLSLRSSFRATELAT